jgi:S1-C subfamily serine protease
MPTHLHKVPHPRCVQVLREVDIDGVLILEVPAGSPAHQAGLRPTYRDVFGDIILGDIIVGIDGRSVSTSEQLYSILDDKRVGDKVRLDIIRDGRKISAMVTLGERVMGMSDE